MRRQPVFTDQKIRKCGCNAGAPPNWSAASMKSLSKSQLAFHSLILTFMWGCKGSIIAETILKKKKKAVGVTFPIQTYHKATEITAVWRWPEDRQAYQWGSVGSPEVNIPIHGQPVSTRAPRRWEERKNNLFKNWCWDHWKSKGRRMKGGPYLTPYTNVNSKWA